MKIEKEIKYKLSLPAENIIDELLNIYSVDKYTLGEHEKKEIVDVYYDNQAFNISKSKSIFRYRVINFNKFLLTLKTTLKRDDQDIPLYIREEFEEQATPEHLIIIYDKLREIGLPLQDFNIKDFYDYGIWGLLKIWELREIFVCENTRLVKKIFHGDYEIGEMCIDDVLISTFGKKETFKELEIEVADESDETIEFIKVFTDYINKNYPTKLITNKYSKFETGMKLLLGDKDVIFEY